MDFSGCEAVVTSATLADQRLAAVPLEPRSAAVEWSADGTGLTFYASTQAPHRVRDTVAALYGLDKPAVRVVTPDVGGGFGAKGTPSPEELVLAGLARAVGRPVTWTESRAENLTASVHGRGQTQRFRLGGTRSGRITHYELDVVQDAGAYPMIGAFLPTYTRKVFTGCYDIAHASASGRSYVTNTAPVTAYRGAGRPEAIFAVERAVDLYAAEIGMDPAEVRRRNFVGPIASRTPTPWAASTTPATTAPPSNGRWSAARYPDLRAEQASRRADGNPRLLGIGIASFVESTSMGPSELGEIELAADGSLVVRTGATAFGQGHATCWAMIAADATGVALDRIRVISGDTAEIASSGLTAASRSAQLAGSAVLTAARHLVELGRGPGRGPLGGRRGRRGARHRHRSVPCGWLAAAAGRLDRDRSRSGRGRRGPACSGVGLRAARQHLRLRVPRGRGGGGLRHRRDGVATHRRLRRRRHAHQPADRRGPDSRRHRPGRRPGAARRDGLRRRDGNPLATNLVDYPAISAPDLPSFELVPMETPTPSTPWEPKASASRAPSAPERPSSTPSAMRGPPGHRPHRHARHPPTHLARPARSPADADARGGRMTAR